MSTRIEYAPGEAWCVAAGAVVLVCERDLAPARAAALHAEAAAVRDAASLRALLEDEPTALLALLDADGARTVLRRHGVPATADDLPMPDRFGGDWAEDVAAADASVAAGGLAALEGARLPFDGGVVRVAAVRVAPAPAAEAAPEPEPAPVAEHAVGAFGQTQPPRIATAPEPEPEPQPAPVAEAALEPTPSDDAEATGPNEPEAARPEASAPEPAQPEASEPELAQPEASEPEPAQPEASEPEPAAPDATEPEPAPAPFDDVPVTGIQPLPPHLREARTLEDAAAQEPATAPAAAATPPEPLPEHSGPLSGLIDSVPGFIRPAAAVRPVAPPASAPEEAAPAAPEPAPAPAPLAPTAAPDAAGDHDGMTVTAEQARALLGDRAPRSGGIDVAAPATGPLVLSTLCSEGHVNAPGTAVCTTCGTAIDDASAAQRRRPEIAVAVLPSGDRIPLGRGVVLGRRPRSRRVEDGRVPRLVTVESPSEDISRSHLELRVEDWNLVAVDLSSTNGTLLLREGAAPQRLRPEASTILQLGDRLDLGDGVVVTIESAP